MQQDEQAIRDLIANWLRATSEGDIETILRLMAEDVVFLTPGNPPMRGREAFAAGFRGAVGALKIEAESEIQEVRVLGGWAWCWHHLTVTMTPKAGGEAMRHAGYVLSVFRREAGGGWVLFRDANLLTPEAAAS